MNDTKINLKAIAITSETKLEIDGKVWVGKELLERLKPNPDDPRPPICPKMKIDLGIFDRIRFLDLERFIKLGLIAEKDLVEFALNKIGVDFSLPSDDPRCPKFRCPKMGFSDGKLDKVNPADLKLLLDIGIVKEGKLSKEQLTALKTIRK